MQVVARILSLGVLVLASLAIAPAGSGSAVARLASPQTPPPLNGITAIAAGRSHTCALNTAGGVKCWGENRYGQVGDDTDVWRIRPVNVVGLTVGVAAITAGRLHTCALTTAGGAKCWGNNSFGAVGDGSIRSRATPVDVSGLTTGVAAIAAGGRHTCAVTTDGAVKCWGQDGKGQLGIGGHNRTYRTRPGRVVELMSGTVGIAGGGHHTCALTTVGAVKCWGGNASGAVGDGSFTDRAAPVDVVGLQSGVTAVAAGSDHTCALTSGGEVKCWGNNEKGQLGDGTNIWRTAPQDVVGLTDEVVAITAGENHTCALTTGGEVKCWGQNAHWQLGDGTTTTRSTPVDVVGLPSRATAIAAGKTHTCAVVAGGEVRCWGGNQSGQLGDGTMTDRRQPVAVQVLLRTYLSLMLR